MAFCIEGGARERWRLPVGCEARGIKHNHPSRPSAAAKPDPADADNGLMGRRVLILDDEASARRMLRAAVATRYDVDVAGTASDALAPPFQVRPVGLEAIQTGTGFWTGRGSSVTSSKR